MSSLSPRTVWWLTVNSVTKCGFPVQPHFLTQPIKITFLNGFCTRTHTNILLPHLCFELIYITLLTLLKHNWAAINHMYLKDKKLKLGKWINLRFYHHNQNSEHFRHLSKVFSWPFVIHLPPHITSYLGKQISLHFLKFYVFWNIMCFLVRLVSLRILIFEIHPCHSKYQQVQSLIHMKISHSNP
jgi:hypothetical protein